MVPLDKIAQTINELSKVAESYPFQVFTPAHAGDGNLHFSILKGNMTDEAWEKALHDFHAEAYPYIYAMGGKLSGEHGIGAKKVKQLASLADPGELYMMQTIKKPWIPRMFESGQGAGPILRNKNAFSQVWRESVFDNSG